ncbi:hypothetical protein H4R33_003233, partial [Dimargaris cristalligena]
CRLNMAVVGRPHWIPANTRWEEFLNRPLMAQYNHCFRCRTLQSSLVWLSFQFVGYLRKRTVMDPVKTFGMLNQEEPSEGGNWPNGPDPLD